MSYHKTPTPTRYWDNSIHYVTQRAIALVLRYATNVYRRRISLLSADEDIVRAFCEKGLKTYNNGYLDLGKVHLLYITQRDDSNI